MNLGAVPLQGKIELKHAAQVRFDVTRKQAKVSRRKSSNRTESLKKAAARLASIIEESESQLTEAEREARHQASLKIYARMRAQREKRGELSQKQEHRGVVLGLPTT
jgi:tRNA G18 (ribose-2'-O)-methylase SpoU